MKAIITKEQALALLPEGDSIHTFVNAGGALVGADWSREDIEDKIRKSDVLELAGPAARGMRHGLCAYNKGATHDSVLFIETVEEKVVALEAELDKAKSGDLDEREVYTAALNIYGAEAQTLMVFEEMAELQKELCKHARGKDNTAAIAEEIADVEIMLGQMMLLYDCEEAVAVAKAEKLARLADRLKKDG